MKICSIKRLLLLGLPVLATLLGCEKLPSDPPAFPEGRFLPAPEGLGAIVAPEGITLD